MNKNKQTKSMKRLLTMVSFVLVTAASSQVNAQNGVGINPTGAAADPSAALDVSATNKGVLVPRMTEAEKVAIASPANGLLIFQTDGVSGFWYYNATTSAWMPIAGSQLPTSLTGLIIGNGTSAMTGLSGTNSGETINWNNTTGTWQVTGTSSLALGNNAGQTTQGQSAVAVGTNAGQTSQAANSVAIGNTAGQTTQGQSAVAMGSFAGSMNQGVNSIAMGNNAGGNDQGNGAVAIGRSAGYAAQGQSAVAMGSGAGYIAQGQSAVAIGTNAGQVTQSEQSVAIGNSAGSDTQGLGAVAIGNTAGQTTQGQSAVAIGYSAGYSNQGANSIAIGNAAGPTNQAANSIILNASGVDLNSTTDGLFIKPIRNAASPNVLSYDPLSGEVTHSTVGMPSGIILPFAGSAVPSGYLLCDGSEVSRTTYSNLFATLSVSWGSGNGTTTFNLPDLRGRFMRGVDGTAGNDPDVASRTAINVGGNVGNNVGSLQGDALKYHSHNLPYSTTANGASLPEITGPASGFATYPTSFAGDSSESRPKNVNVNYIIKY